jgi:hypothetical protein
VSNNITPRAITGKIGAKPNPIPFLEGSSTVICWETDDPEGAEVRVSTATDENKLVSRGRSGSYQVPWIVGTSDYNFDLYGSTQPARRLDRVTVRRSRSSLERVLTQLAAEANSGYVDLDQLARLIAKVMPRCVNNTRFPELFRIWEAHGFHVTPVHFYQPIPDTRAIPETIWDRPSELAGLDMNDAVQLDLLRNCFPKFRDEYEQLPSAPTGDPRQFHFNNGRFDGTDALVTYCMVRHFRPRLIIEIGSGYSSLISGQAASKNGDSSLICIEPFPLDFLVKGFPGLRSLIEKKVEDVELEFFSQLKTGDILFIDSSHTVKIGGDVNYLFLEVLPRLNPGVIVHVHDIGFPFDYRREWVMDELRFWTEQYLLQAFLAFNSQFEVLICNSYLGYRYLEDFKATFPTSPCWGGGSFWMRRKQAAAESPQNVATVMVRPA